MVGTLIVLLLLFGFVGICGWVAALNMRLEKEFKRSYGHSFPKNARQRDEIRDVVMERVAAAWYEDQIDRGIVQVYTKNLAPAPSQSWQKAEDKRRKAIQIALYSQNEYRRLSGLAQKAGFTPPELSEILRLLGNRPSVEQAIFDLA